MALDRPTIVAAAGAILDAYGLADLSMRRVAMQLGVRPGALYWHVENKQAVLAALSDEILRGLPNTGGEPVEVIGTWARALRGLLLSRRDAAELVASVVAMRLGEVSPIDHLAARLSLPEPRLTAAAVTHFVLGHCADEQGHAQLVELGVAAAGEATDQDAAFEHGIGLLTAGLGCSPQ